MSKKKFINLGKVRARTKELRLNGTVIEHKYDDEQNWQPLVDLSEAGSSIDTVSAHSELPSDARENDVAIVEEEEYVRTENKTTVLSIEVKAPTEVIDIYNINFRDSFNSILNNEEVKSLGSALNVRLETETRDIMYVDIGAEIAPMMAGVDHPAQVVAVMNSDEDMSFYVSGISIRDFLQLMMELEFEEEQWATLLGSHANDNSADSPSYGWVNMVMSTEPINDNSLAMDSVYATLLFDSEAPKITDILGNANVGIMTTSGENIDASTSLYSTYDSSSDVDPEEQAFVLKFLNLALNNIAHGGIIEQSNDIYNPKGLFQNDNGEWVSLEAKMNTPRFVDTYADLPKTSIENGIMAVAKESIYRSEPELTTKLEMLKKYRISSVDDITVEVFDSIIEEILPGYPTTGNADIGLELITLDENTALGLYLYKYFYNGVVPLYYTMIEVNNYETYKGKKIAYFTEAPDGFEAGNSIPPDKDSGEILEFYPEVGKWYWCDVIDDGKNVYSVGGIHEGFPIDLPDELLFYGGEIYWDEDIYPATASEVSTYESDSTYSKYITSIDLKVFNFEDLSSSLSITYPAGFYRYNDNEWRHIEDVSGGNFENEDVLRAITSTDVGNIQENTEKRHEHNNQYYLDQIQWDTVDKINQNTSARHTHDNKDYIDQIDYFKMNEINQSINQSHTHSNKSYLDQIDSSAISRIGEISYNTNARHTHSNKPTLDKITDSHLTNITSNTNARHTHSNSTTLNKITGAHLTDISSNTTARHTHSNKSTLDKITESKLTDIASNKSARHSHNNQSVLDKIVESSNGSLLYGSIPLGNIISNKTGSELSANSIIILNVGSTESINTIPDGESWLCFRGHATITFPGDIKWKNGFPPPVCYQTVSRERYGSVIPFFYDVRLIRFTKAGSYTTGEWFMDSTFKIDSRLVPNGYNCNFGKIENGQFNYAPLIIDESLNNETLYLENGYKRVVGEDPLELSKELKTYDDCELFFKEYDDFIVVGWIVTPKGYRMGEFINSLYITDWSSFFSEVEDETLDNIIIGDLDFTNATSLSYIFSGGAMVLLPVIDLSTVSLDTELDSMFYYASNLVTIKKIIFNSTKLSRLNYMFRNCENLENVVFEGKIKVDCASQYFGLDTCPKLSRDTLVSFLEALESNNNEEEQYTIFLGTANLDKLSESDKLIAADKNILLA